MAMTDTMHPKEIECPKCDGKGTVLQEEQNDGIVRAVQKTCPLCNGAGKVDVKKLTDDPLALQK